MHSTTPDWMMGSPGNKDTNIGRGDANMQVDSFHPIQKLHGVRGWDVIMELDEPMG